MSYEYSLLQFRNIVHQKCGSMEPESYYPQLNASPEGI